MKTCKRCDLEKNESEYYFYSDGYLHGSCKVCMRKVDTDRRKGIKIPKVEHTPWNKGKTGVYSEQTLQDMGKYWRGKKVPPELIARRQESLRKGVSRNSHKYQQWRLSVIERDDLQCKHCGDDNENRLHAHHIVPWNDDESLRFELHNGIALCASCHNIEEAKTNKKRKTSWNKGMKLSAEHREKLSKARIGKIPWNKGKKGAQVAWNKGVTMSESTKLKIKRRALGRNLGKTWIIDPKQNKRVWVEQ